MVKLPIASVAVLFTKKKIKEKINLPITLKTNYPDLTPFERPLTTSYSELFTSDSDKESSIRITLKLPSHRFYIGMKNILSILVDNNTNSSTISGITVKLTAQRYEFFEEVPDTESNNQRSSRKSTIFPILLEVMEHLPLMPKNNQEYGINFPLSQDVLPSMRKDESPLIYLEYSLTVECKLDDPPNWQTVTGTNRVYLSHYILVCHPTLDLLSVSTSPIDSI